MNYKITDIKNGIKLHKINTDKFKTDLTAVFLTTKLSRENVTKNALISMMLRRGSKNMPTQEQISRNLEEMYGATFDCGLDKTGDNQVLKFYIETINDNFLPNNNESLLKKSMQTILEIIFNPYTENGSFKEEYLEQEKNNLKLIIEGKIDNKAKYAIDRCIEEMYKNEEFGLYKYGYVEDLENINCEELYKYYQELINSCKIDIFVSGPENNQLKNFIEENENIVKLQPRDANYTALNIKPKDKVTENIVTESKDVTQGKLIIGLDVNIDNEDLKYDTLIYNSILGGSANSKLFQNVREKAHLAYVASSSYLRYKSNIFINCGIEIGNYEKALEISKEQIKDMESGNFTEEEIENAKKGIIASIKSIDDEQDTQITYYFGQELTQMRVTPEEYIDRVNKVSKDDVLNIAKKVSINTIYFLRD